MKKILVIFYLIFFSSEICWSQVDKTLVVLQEIFSDYVKYDETTDSDTDKEKLINAFKDVKRRKLVAAIPLLIDIYLYYDPTDFPTREYVLDAFESIKGEAKVEVDKRIQLEKGKNESDGDWPCGDLLYLKDKLK